MLSKRLRLKAAPKPDQAMIDIGVVTQGATAVAVAAQNAKQTEGVISRGTP
jgi:uncharacterized protein YggE